MVVFFLGLPASVFAFAWFVYRSEDFLESIKQRLTYPRTGYAAPPSQWKRSERDEAFDASFGRLSGVARFLRKRWLLFYCAWFLLNAVNDVFGHPFHPSIRSREAFVAGLGVLSGTLRIPGFFRNRLVAIEVVGYSLLGFLACKQSATAAAHAICDSGCFRSGTLGTHARNRDSDSLRTPESAVAVMTTSILELGTLDRVIHEPARLMIMATLYSVPEADFLYLQRELGLTQGNLSSHLARLEQEHYVLLEKMFKGKYPLTVCSLTVRGREAFEEYARKIRAIPETARGNRRK